MFALEALETKIEDVEVVCDFLDVFQEIPSIPPCRVVDFRLDLVPNTVPISKALHRMAPKLPDEIKKQLAKHKGKG